MTNSEARKRQQADVRKEREQQEAAHVMRWTWEDGGVRGEAVCNAEPGADCRLTSVSCGCEFWGRIERRADGTIWHLIAELDGKGYVPQPGDWHELAAQDECNIALSINESGCAEELATDDHPAFVVAETPFEPVGDFDGSVLWRPITTGASS